MGKLLDHLLRLQVALLVHLVPRLLPRSGRRRRDDRGDVPGWVLVTVMSAAIVMGIWGIAKPQLEQMLQAALDKVK